MGDWADIQADAVGDCLDQLGEAAAWGDGTAVTAHIRRRAEPILRGGQIVIDEDHYDGMIAADALDADPAMGDTLTAADGSVYRVDVPPELRDGLWLLTLRKTA